MWDLCIHRQPSSSSAEFGGDCRHCLRLHGLGVRVIFCLCIRLDVIGDSIAGCGLAPEIAQSDSANIEHGSLDYVER